MKKAILLLHGYATDKSDFANIVYYLEGIYDEIFCENLPGHGLEKNDHLEDFNAVDTIKCVDKWAEDLFSRYDEVDLIGFSMGGALATYLATCFNFHRIVLLAPANKYINTKIGFSKTKLWFDYIIERITRKNNQKVIDIYEESVMDNKKSYNMAMKNLLPSYTPRSLRHFMSVIEYCNDKLKDTKITVPVLIAYGTVDQLVPKSSIDFVMKYTENARLLTLKGISHLMFNSTNIRALTEEVVKFLCEDE